MVEELPAEIIHKGESITLRIKKPPGAKPKKAWRIRYISANPYRAKRTVSTKGLNYTEWKKLKATYRTRLRSEGPTLEIAAVKMLEQIKLLKEGLRELSEY